MIMVIFGRCCNIFDVVCSRREGSKASVGNLLVLSVKVNRAQAINDQV